jgi:cytochrome P450
MSTSNITGLQAFLSRPRLGLDDIVSNPLWSVTPLVVLVLSLVLLQKWVSGSKKKLNMPPTPKGLPLFGTMFQTRGPQVHKTMLRLSKTWGDIFALKTGLKYFVVVVKADIAHDALIKQSQIFSTRTRVLSRLNFTGFRSVNSALYGPYWREIRKNMVTQVLNNSKVESFKPFRELELNNLMKRTREQAKRNNNVVPVLSNCRFTVFSILLHVAFGQGFDESKVGELDVVLRRLLVLLAPQVVDFLPFIQRFSKYHINECQALLGSMRKIFGPLIEERREMRKNGKYLGDYVDSLLALQEKIGLKETDVLGLTGELMAGGTDTTANTIQWAMAYLVQNQDMQERLYQEIKSVVGVDRQVEESDIEKVPYLQAVAKEAMRKHPSLPFGITHGLTQQTTLRGYDIPEDAMMLFHIQAFQNDPEHWDHPEIFNPDRFMSAVPNPLHDMTGSHGPRSLDFIPFGCGRRICPGMDLALKHVHLILARWIHTFKWTTVNPGENVDFSDQIEFTLVMTNPLHARIQERSEIIQDA